MLITRHSAQSISNRYNSLSYNVEEVERLAGELREIEIRFALNLSHPHTHTHIYTPCVIGRRFWSMERTLVWPSYDIHSAGRARLLSANSHTPHMYHVLQTVRPYVSCVGKRTDSCLNAEMVNTSHHNAIQLVVMCERVCVPICSHSRLFAPFLCL